MEPSDAWQHSLQSRELRAQLCALRGMARAFCVGCPASCSLQNLIMTLGGRQVHIKTPPGWRTLWVRHAGWLVSLVTAIVFVSIDSPMKEVRARGRGWKDRRKTLRNFECLPPPSTDCACLAALLACRVFADVEKHIATLQCQDRSRNSSSKPRNTATQFQAIPRR